MDQGEADRRRDVSGVGTDRPRWWLACVRAATVSGLVCALVLWGWQSVVGLAVSLLVIATLAVVAVWGGEGEHDLRETATVSVQLTVLLTAAAGLIGATEAWALLVVLALVATSPHVDLLRRVKGWVGPPATPVVGRAAVGPGHHCAPDGGPTRSFIPPVAEDVAGLDDAALVLAWRHSFVQLEGAGSELERLTVVARRQQLLDELERRCPEGVARWLASGARAQGNPQPYLDGPREGPSTEGQR